MICRVTLLANQGELEQPATGRDTTNVAVGSRCRQATPRSSLNESLAQQIRLVGILQSLRLFPDSL